jgi:phosphatidylinositol alpha-1,6-mannosyltransferase
MNVLLLTTDFPPLIGGIGTFARNLARGLQSAGVRVSVVTSVAAAVREPVGDLVVRRGPAPLDRKGLKIVPLTWLTLRERRPAEPTRVLAMAWTHEGTTALLLRRCLGLPYALVAHGSEILRHRAGWGRRPMRAVFAGADAVICNSDFTRRLVQSEGLAREAHVVNPPVEMPELPTPGARARLEERLGLRGRRVLLTAARMVKRKGHARVLEALAELKERYPDLVYVATGDGPLRSALRDLATARGLADSVRMPGPVSDEDLACLFHTATIYVSPAEPDDDDIEGFGIALVEAGLCGTPVVAGRGGGVGDAVVDGETGLLIDAGDRGALRESLVRLLDDRDLRGRLGDNARRRAAQRFSVKTQGERLADILGGVQEAHRAVR